MYSREESEQTGKGRETIGLWSTGVGLWQNSVASLIAWEVSGSPGKHPYGCVSEDGSRDKHHKALTKPVV